MFCIAQSIDTVPRREGFRSTRFSLVPPREPGASVAGEVWGKVADCFTWWVAGAPMSPPAFI